MVSHDIFELRIQSHVSFIETIPTFTVTGVAFNSAIANAVGFGN